MGLKHSISAIRKCSIKIVTPFVLKWDTLHIGARVKKPAYGLNDAPRAWWNILGSAPRSYGLAASTNSPTRADCCRYVYYGKQLSRPTPISARESSNTCDLEGAVGCLVDPVSVNNAQNRQAREPLRVDDLLMTGDDVFEKES